MRLAGKIKGVGEEKKVVREEHAGCSSTLQKKHDKPLVVEDFKAYISLDEDMVYLSVIAQI